VKTLLLWDIDGTLITSGGAGMKAMRVALQRVFAIEGSLDDIEFAGRTDRWIARRIFEKFSIAITEENFTRYFDGYIAALPAELANPNARVLKGVLPLLNAVAMAPDVVQGLLTGNIRRGAETKLTHHGLWKYFPFGAFADDHELRDHLGTHALQRALAHTGFSFPRKRTWVIGDTPHDIACGKIAGVRTLAVATGSHTAEQLAEHKPDAIMPDLADTNAFWNIVG
jgi:phosphoglycolate phosphatase-like HAD superfamily hydrolase